MSAISFVPAMRCLLVKRVLVPLVTLFSLLATVSFAVLFLNTGASLDNFQVHHDFTKGLALVVAPWAKKLLHSKPCGNRDNTRKSPCLPDLCATDEFTVWEEWKVCKQQELLQTNWKANRAQVTAMIANATMKSPLEAVNTTIFEDFIIESRIDLPWSLDSNYTAVMLEFRPWARQLSFSINNAMDNLPVNWRVQVLGGPSILTLMQDLFPAEITAGKIVLTDIGRDQGSKVSE